MKRVKFLALVLVVAVMLVGTAYALWNQNITLTTTAAMGEMDVEVVCDAHVYPLSVMPGLPFGLPEDYMNPITGSVSSDRQSISVTVGDLYPGAEYGLNFTIKNTGDVPFCLSDVVITCTDNWGLFTKLTGELKFAYQSENFLPQYITVPANSLSDGSLATAIETACKDVILYPGDELVGWWSHQDIGTTFMQISVDSSITGDDFENQTTGFDIDFVWEQCAPIAA
ncbi:MAG: hypothetical protein EOM54_06655 [Clostridia bacterium]|nr:hypothetical protein [Clostridia bacterium]